MHQQQKSMAGRPPQQLGVIGGGMRAGGDGMGSLGWSGACDDDLHEMQNGLRGLGLGGVDRMGGGNSHSIFGGNSNEAQSNAEIEQARLQVL